jgi:RimJ/RimL family protein N-acetyltransferase
MSESHQKQRYAPCAPCWTTPAARSIGCCCISDNRQAIRLYESEGFVSYGLEGRALKLGDRYLDEYMMVLFLT